MFKDRVIDVDKYREFATILGSLTGIRDRSDNFISKEWIAEYSANEGARIKEYMDNISEDVSGLKIIDLFDPEFLDNDLYDDGLVFTQNFYINMRNSIRLLNELQISPNRTVSDVNEANRVVSNEILQNAMIRLLTDYQEAIKSHNVDSGAVVAIEEATKDQVIQVVTPDYYLRELGVDVPEKIEEIWDQYEDEYNQFVSDRVDAILTALLSNLENPTFIILSGVSEIRSKLAEMFKDDQELVDHYNTLDPSQFIFNAGHVFDKASSWMQKQPSTEIPNIANKLRELLINFINANKFGDFEVQDMGKPSKQPLLKTIAIVDIILHAFVLASADIWDVTKETEDDLDVTTKYIVDLVNLEISERLVGADEDVAVSDYTAYRFLSTVSVANDLVVARNAVLRWRLPSWNKAISTIYTMILQRFNPERYAEVQQARMAELNQMN
jgi:hypothetical protein